MMMIKESCELHATGPVYRDIPPNEQNDLSSGLLHSSSDDDSNSETSSEKTATASDDGSNSDSEMDQATFEMLATFEDNSDNVR